MPFLYRTIVGTTMMPSPVSIASGKYVLDLSKFSYFHHQRQNGPCLPLVLADVCFVVSGKMLDQELFELLFQQAMNPKKKIKGLRLYEALDIFNAYQKNPPINLVKETLQSAFSDVNQTKTDARRAIEANSEKIYNIIESQKGALIVRVNAGRFYCNPDKNKYRHWIGILGISVAEDGLATISILDPFRGVIDVSLEHLSYSLQLQIKDEKEPSGVGVVTTFIHALRHP